MVGSAAPSERHMATDRSIFFVHQYHHTSLIISNKKTTFQAARLMPLFVQSSQLPRTPYIHGNH
ncbi:hypothetical protein QC761_0064370 [Podospora bellae-mahoneyi]|uniref:Uncharacterized protein n=1 Tax=Podospora bellae-mahoneyi TaxID=2093777 RepID=A0ABR0FGL3_9PEZI|nr:hypothetical protein QC761_0064370 [Podospora bellae-mahoneyi]